MIILIDHDFEIVIVADANEEESNSKNQVGFEFDINEIQSNVGFNSHLIKTLVQGHYYKENRYAVFLNISSPPPKFV